MPILTMNPIYTQTNPQAILRSKLFSLNTATYFSCNSSYTIAYKWSLKLIQNSSSHISIDLSSNPTWQSTSLVIQAYTLSYGLYEFNFQTNATITKANNVVVALTNNLATYVQIVPTGFAVFGLQNGVSGLLVGTQQSFSLKPALYSLDLDSLVQPSSLQYKFYCFTINQNSITTVNTSLSVDLFTYKNNSLLQMNSNATCFQTNSKFF